MAISTKKRAFLEEIVGVEEAGAMLKRLTQLEADLKAQGVEFKDTEASDSFAELVARVALGEVTEDDVRRIFGGALADQIVAVVSGGDTKASKDLLARTASKVAKDEDALTELATIVKRLKVIVTKLEAAKRPTTDLTPNATISDDANPDKKKKDFADDPILAHYKALAEGRVVRGG